MRRRHRGRRSGAAIVEFAVGSGILLAVFSGTFEVGYTLIQYNRLQIAVAQGARYASLVPYDSPTATPSTAFVSSVRNVVLYGTPSTGATPVVSGLTAANISLVVTFANGVPNSIEVLVGGYTINALFGSHTLTGKPRVTYPYQGIWAPA
jgi:Flp pilus assembly protein TadG